ncbi:cupin domain-containing protein [Stutzerimonas tarimensis]|uniref:Cupin domain-containing protein n=1 Tax=Stutzerimonas tarimensis TaxID=1507735 RepID=A0ABV7T675_9GAMM
MQLNADFSFPARVDSAFVAWQPTPYPGISRLTFDRLGDQVVRATSLVRFDPDSTFGAHEHGGGEEIFVLGGVFSDEQGDYPAGSYLRFPPGSRHQPFSRKGCVLFVKTWQFAPDDRDSLVLDTRRQHWRPGLVEGLSILPLHQHGEEHTALVRWQPGTRFNPHGHPGGEEIYVIDGVFSDETGHHPAGTWLRNPRDSWHTPYSLEGALILVKTGHLARANCWDAWQARATAR